MIFRDYSFTLPDELVAHNPVEPRDSARLFVFSTSTNEIILDTFRNISRYIPAGSLMVLNDTKVVPSRLELTKITGGTVRILLLLNEWNKSETVKGLPDREVRVGDALFFNHKKCLEAVSQNNEEFTFKILVPIEEFAKICEKNGRMPLPPYIKTSLDDDQTKQSYQTIFAVNPASVAAPTAALHFTDRVMESLKEKGVAHTFVSLHVGRGTFSPVNQKMMDSRSLHVEPVEISQQSAQAILDAKKQKKPVVSVGTTATRLLESTADHILNGRGFIGETNLFILPPYEFKIVDMMITNFHLPNTSLLMLLDSFLQHKKSKQTWRQLYDAAIREKFRFYTFGDAMLIV